MRSIVASTMAILLMAAADAKSCDCVEDPAKAKADLVFEGSPRIANEWQLKGVDSGNLLAHVVRYTFDVERIIEGPTLSQVVIDGFSGGDCAYQFEIGKRYRVYARSQLDLGIQWLADTCTRTVKIESTDAGSSK